MDFAISISGFVALYVFDAFVAFAGWVIIGHVPALLLQHAADVGLKLRPRHCRCRRDFLLLNASSVLEQVIGFFAVLLVGQRRRRLRGAYSPDARHVPDERSAPQLVHARAKPRPSLQEGLRNPDAHQILNSLSAWSIPRRPFSSCTGCSECPRGPPRRSGILVVGIGMLAAVLASFLYVFSVSAAAQPHLCQHRPCLDRADRRGRRRPAERQE